MSMAAALFIYRAKLLHLQNGEDLRLLLPREPVK